MGRLETNVFLRRVVVRRFTLIMLSSLFTLLAAAVVVRAETPVAELLQRAAQADSKGQHSEVVALTTKAIQADAKVPDSYYLRGRAQFRLGKIVESIADFDQYVALRPGVEPRLWERGISYYYAGQYEKGAKQFELYQTFRDNDVENAVWRYLCMARSVGVPKARAALLPIKNDRRVPMTEVYELYGGRLEPDDVLKAAGSGEPSPEALKARLFYTHLYLGLYYEAEGNRPLASEHIVKAAEKYKIGHYMWDVAHVHADQLRREKKG